ncbi:hypothetical protein BJ166DRAFT_512164 [Pestalotiopsis sp. NC0098]|nr:hypothetical protein BJ166DRAFT_512164 [Pestalotiopsis sp. NC0098]
MVNTGQASKGCTTCRRRRIRCDATRPVCQRCVKSSRICLGYTATQGQPRPPIPQDVSNVTDIATDDSQTSVLSPGCSSDVYRTTEILNHSAAPNNLMVARTRSDTPDTPGTSGQPEDPPPSPELDKLAKSVFEVVNDGLSTLQRQIQTRQERQVLFARYGQATRQLRKALECHFLPETMFLPVLLFSLYEMIVNIHSDDKTWHIHLDGLLHLIARSSVIRETAHLHTALKFMESDNHMSNNISAIAVEKDPSAAYLLLDVTKLRLRQIVPNIHELFEKSSKRPRKIDVQKFKVQIKKIFTDLELFPVMISGYESHSEVHDTVAVRLNEYRTLQIMTASFLFWSADFLHTTNDFHSTREFTNLYTVIQDAAKDIRSRTEPYINQLSSDMYKQGQAPLQLFPSASMLLFPLYCASRAPCLAEGERQWFTDSLGLLGSRAFIPKASALANEDTANDVPFRSCGWGLSYQSWSDVLAGLLLLNPALLNSPCRITGQS